MFETPILFLVFNRPDTTKLVFERIRAIKPTRLYIASDGPRQSKQFESEIVEEVRSIFRHIDWDCQVQKLYREENLGCKMAVSSAISWFFDQEAEGIILEDDCLPEPDFFTFCSSLLLRYRDDERVGFISGTTLCDIHKSKFSWDKEDYVFCKYPSVWGWATWRRVWLDYDVNVSDWPSIRNDIFHLAPSNSIREINQKLLDNVHDGLIDTWDYQVSFLLWSTNRLSIAPRFNLIENIGFGENATHTTTANEISKLAKASTERLSFPLIEPSHLIPNFKYQKFLESLATPKSKVRFFRRIISYVYRSILH